MDSFTSWHYVKVFFYWIFLFAGIYCSWLCANNMLCICYGKFMCNAEFVISVIVLVAVIVLLFIWGFFGSADLSGW